MTRRLLFVAALTQVVARAKSDREPTMPTDPVMQNVFVARYNAFAEAENKGLADVHLWKAVVKAWRGMTGE